jgi:hypothetical protein
MGKNTGPQTGGCIIKARKHSPSLILTCITVSITRSGGLAVKRITSNDEIPGSSPGRSLVDDNVSFLLLIHLLCYRWAGEGGVVSAVSNAVGC